MFAFLDSTFTDSATFWSAIEALATLGALVLLMREIPKIKREISSHKIEGLKFAREVLQSSDFENSFKVIKKIWKDGGSKYPSSIDSHIVEAFSRLDLVATLVEEKYIDENLLLYEFGPDLYLLERFITNFEHREDTQIHGVRATYPKAYDLLKSASRYSQKRLNDTSQRHEKFINEDAS